MILKELVEQLLQTAGLAGLTAPVSVNGQRIERVAFGAGRVWMETEKDSAEPGARPPELPGLMPEQEALRGAVKTCLRAYRRNDPDLLEEAMEELADVLEESR